MVRERQNAETHPAQFVVERLFLDDMVRVDVLGDSSCRVVVDGHLTITTCNGWSLPDLAELADRTVAAVEPFRRAGRGATSALRSDG